MCCLRAIMRPVQQFPFPLALRPVAFPRPGQDLCPASEQAAGFLQLLIHTLPEGQRGLDKS